MPKGLKDSLRIARRNKHITPRLNNWLVQNDTGIKIQSEAVAERIFEMMAPGQISKGRHGAFHPSQLYQCRRAQVFGYHNAPTHKSYSPTLMNLFNDGHFRHLRWQIMLLSAGIIEEVEVPVSSPKLRLEGSMDGVNWSEGWMFELKGTSQFRQVQQRGAMPAHIKQVHAYLLMAGLEKAIIVYEDKSSQDWLEIEVERDDEISAQITYILSKLNSAIDNNTLPEVLSECKNQEGEYKSCPYASICLGIKRPEEIAASVSVGRRNPNRKRTPSRN